MSVLIKINDEGYVIHSNKPHRKKDINSNNINKIWKDWWLVKPSNKNNYCHISLGKFDDIYLPVSYFGKRVKLKLEVIDDETSTQR